MWGRWAAHPLSPRGEGAKLEALPALSHGLVGGQDWDARHPLRAILARQGSNKCP